MNLETFMDRESASSRAAEIISVSITKKLQASTRATIALSGGTTPISCMQKLSNIELPWQLVDVTLTDERSVPVEHTASNERLLRENFLVGAAEKAAFVKMSEENLADISPCACLLLGMGEDGHVASLFPDSNQLEQGLTASSAMINVQTPSSEYARQSLTFHEIARSEVIVVLFFGDKKKQVLTTPGNLPVHLVAALSHAIFIWAP